MRCPVCAGPVLNAKGGAPKVYCSDECVNKASYQRQIDRGLSGIRLVRSRESRERLKAEMFAAYGAECACCGEREPVFLAIDHIGGGGRETGATLWYSLKARGWPQEGFRLLCHNCNMATMLGRVCPHQEAHRG